MVRDNLKVFYSLFERFSDPYEGTLYHYTSSQGLQGIIENHELWLTNTEFVNDLKECKALKEENKLFKDADFINEEVLRAWKNFKDAKKITTMDDDMDRDALQ